MTWLTPAGTRLLHIGPAKTGTTSLQSAFHRNREAIAAHGVHYAGRGSQPRAAAGAVATRARVAGHREGLEAWPKLVAEVRESTADRVVISSETFARADDEAARTVVEAFGPDRTEVVITMRPLADMLSSSWQQYVQTGAVRTWDEWLDFMLRSPDTVHGDQPDFWRKTRIDVLARRWGALVGPEHVTVVSLAGEPRDFVLRTFERFTGLPAGTLRPDPGAENASLGHGAAETVRRFNRLLFDVPGADYDLQAKLVEFGAVRRLRTAPEALADDVRIEVPEWAAARAGELAAEMNAGVRAAGVRTVGDLDALTVVSRAPADRPTPGTIDTEAAAQLMIGMLLAAGGGALPEPGPTRRAIAAAEIERLSTPALVGLAGRRIADRVRRRLGR